MEILSKENRTIVLYESPHRLLKTLDDLIFFFGLDKNIAICKEISKVFQEIIRGNIKEIITFYKKNVKKILGEYTIIINKN